ATLRPMSSLTPELVAKVLLRQGRIAPEHAELIEKEARSVPRRVRSHQAYEQRAVAYELIASLQLPDRQSPGDTVGELAIAQAIAADAKLDYVRIDALSLDADLMESKMSRPFARRHRMIPLQMANGKLRVACANPY